ERFEWDLLGLQRRIRAVQYDPAVAPASGELTDDRIRPLDAHRLHHGAGGILDEVLQRPIQPGDGHLRLRGLQLGAQRLDCPLPVVKSDFRRLFLERLDRADAVLGVADLHPDAQRFNLHELENSRPAGAGHPFFASTAIKNPQESLGKSLGCETYGNRSARSAQSYPWGSLFSILRNSRLRATAGPHFCKPSCANWTANPRCP